MSSILEVNEEDFACTVEAGVTHKSLNHNIRETGLMFPVGAGSHGSQIGTIDDGLTSPSGTSTTVVLCAASHEGERGRGAVSQQLPSVLFNTGVQKLVPRYDVCFNCGGCYFVER
ncbi:hypothetical protein AVEN_136308-1 [Araneus ventricosus]|uniref:FAD linked oxidase N-terminal domain-containing protein n=1 Tax=Araneus ventricosus TaxID=182803 RepID=A0A4Y2RFZ5_ARAVE|nr:hypothetical protein AVEN_136308-1 [Araneus ventricosus]